MTYTPVDAIPTKQDRFRNPNKSKNTNKIKQNYWLILLSSLDIAAQFYQNFMTLQHTKIFSSQKINPKGIKQRAHNDLYIVFITPLS
jgi:hypothetical protein